MFYCTVNFLIFSKQNSFREQYICVDVDAIAAKARRLGIEYLKLKKDQDLDDWLAQAIGRI